MAESIARYFRLMPMGRKQRPSERTWCPAADIYQTQHGWIVKVELAGVRTNELEISIEGSTLRIAGCRRDTLCAETVSYHQLEITYSRFEKTLQFPSRINATSIERDYRDGLLILYLRSNEDGS